MGEYYKAPAEVMKLLGEIANREHRRLDGCKMAVIMKDKAGTNRGKTIIATASRPSAHLKPLLKTKYDFVFVIGQSAWDDLSDKQKEAVLDHELCHCSLDADNVPCMRGHDLEEFGEIIERHGFWRDDCGERAVQMGLTGLGVDLKGIAVSTLDLDAPPVPSEDELVGKAIALIKETKRASTSSIQRNLRIGYTRAAKIMDILEERGIIGPANGTTPREILVAA